MSPFKKPKADAEAKAKPVEASAKTPEQIEAEKTIARGERVSSLSNEAAMWRSFSTGCKKGRWLMEHRYSYFYEAPPRLSLTMDEDSALLWSEFAIRMAEDRERRLKDVLGL